MTDVRLGVVGTGFIGSNFVASLDRHADMRASKILTRRPAETVSGYGNDVVTNSIDDLISNCDVVIECSGDPIWATDVVSAAVEVGRPVVTMNTEFHITSGSSFVGSGLVTEAEGDQPGCLASLHEEAVAMGFTPVVYGNMKGFLNPDPTPDEMDYWGAKQGISLPMVTSFTDGTKVQAEQILVANHYGATLIEEGMLGPQVEDLEEGVSILSSGYESQTKPVSDFIVSRTLPHGVFLVATHQDDQAPALEYYKLGPGPYYTIIRNNIFVHLEIVKTVRRVLDTGTILLDNSDTPKISLAAATKKPVPAGTRIDQAIGSFEFRGRAVYSADYPEHVPIGLIQDSTVQTDLDPGVLVTAEDIELPPSLAVSLWRNRGSRLQPETA